MDSKRSDEFDGQCRTLFRINCTLCDSDIWVPNYAVRSRKYCSTKCARLSSRNKVSVTCGNCSVTFLRQPSSLKSKTGYNFCTKSCKDDAQRLDSGVGYTLSHYKDGSGGSYRRRALQEYGNQCTTCGYAVSSKMLDVHHKDGDRANNLLENLEVLCVWCHALETRNVSTHPRSN